ncbi:hypothetical protein F5884DRAFT_789815, partial [Xylogone sp. PMI_703]
MRRRERSAFSTSMRSLLVRNQLFPVSNLPRIQATYPNLVSLRMIISDAYEQSHLTHSFEGLTRFRHLQYLSMTTTHKLTWSGLERSYWLHSNDTMPPFLRQMKSLQYLRVDFIWLAPRDDPGQLLHIASQLPTSIKSLHLLDYWGIAMTKTRHDMYPVFPNNMPPLEFMYLVLESLLQNYSLMGLTSLREVKLSSMQLYAWDLMITPTAFESRRRLIEKFSQAGICLTLTGLREVRREEDEWWLNL